MSDKWKELAAKILRIAHDPGAPQGERDAAMAQATRIMAKYSLTENMLEFEAGTPQSVESLVIHIKNPYAAKKEIIVNTVASAFGCTAVKIDKSVMIRIFGFPGDLEKIQYLYNSVIVQLFVGLSQVDCPPWENGKTFRNSWVNGFITTVGKRITTTIRKAADEVRTESTGMDLMLRNRMQMIKFEVSKAYPDLKSRSYHFSSNSTLGYRMGTEAGKNADIGQTRIGGRNEIEG